MGGPKPEATLDSITAKLQRRLTLAKLVLGFGVGSVAAAAIFTFKAGIYASDVTHIIEGTQAQAEEHDGMIEEITTEVVGLQSRVLRLETLLSNQGSIYQELKEGQRIQAERLDRIFEALRNR